MMTPEEIAKKFTWMPDCRCGQCPICNDSETEFAKRTKPLADAVREALMAERERCFNEVLRLQQEAHDELEKFGGEPLMKVKDRHKMAARGAWHAKFELLTRLKWFIDPSSAPTSEVSQVK